MKKILIADDDFLVSKMIAQGLEAAGFEVLKASTVEDALRFLQKEMIAMVLLDLNFQGEMKGYGVLTYMRNVDAYKQTPVIVISNDGHLNEMEKAKDLGATDFMPKSSTDVKTIVQGVINYVGE